MLDVLVRDMWAPDLENGFFEALAALRNSDLTLEKAREFYRKRLAQGVKTYVAILGIKKVLGTVTLIPEQKFYGLVAHIEDVAVHPNHQRQDIGTKLMKHAVAEAKQMGCYKIILDCTDDVRPFYETLGFSVHNLG